MPWNGRNASSGERDKYNMLQAVIRKAELARWEKRRRAMDVHVRGFYMYARAYTLARATRKHTYLMRMVSTVVVNDFVFELRLT